MSKKRSDSIQVYAQLRHSNNSFDDNESDHYSINQADSSLTILDPNSKSHLKFDFNHIFKCKTTNTEIFDHFGKALLDQAIKGYNCSLIGYGQSVNQNDSKDLGLIYEFMNQLFTNLKIKDKENQQLSFIKVSFIENCHDKMRDLLLSSKDQEPLKSDLTEEHVKSMKDIDTFIGIAKANLYSSRSHWIMIVKIEQKTHDSCTTISKLNFVDLAQSAEVKLFRDSIITHLLQDSFGDDTKTSLLITLNMDKNMCHETISICRFASKAQNILNIAKINKQDNNQLNKQIINSNNKLYVQFKQQFEQFQVLFNEISESVPTELEFEHNVIEFSIAPQTIICSTQLIKSYFTNSQDIQLCEQLKQEQDISSNKKKKKITPKPIRFLIKILRLISPKYKTPGSFNNYSRRNVLRHRKLSDDIMNMNQDYISYTTPGYFGAGRS